MSTHKSRFTASSKRTMGDFQRIMTDIKATSLKIVPQTEITPKGIKESVTVVFDRNGVRYVMASDKWESNNDNLRAIYHTIRTVFKLIDDWGVKSSQNASVDEMFARLFLGWSATPDTLQLGSGSTMWYDVLKIDQGASLEAVRNAYRALSKIHHPDNGGNADTFKKLNDAYNAGLAYVKSRK